MKLVARLSRWSLTRPTLNRLDLSAELFNAHLQLNLTSALLGAQHAAEAVLDAGHTGTIINIGSDDSNHAGARVGYTAAKHGLVGLTKSLARHWGPQGIRVNCVCPGWTNTELNDWNLLGKAWGVTAEQVYQQAADQNLQKRILEPEEVAEVAMGGHHRGRRRKYGNFSSYRGVFLCPGRGSNKERTAATRRGVTLQRCWCVGRGVRSRTRRLPSGP